jgi:hypothetical protein
LDGDYPVARKFLKKVELQHGWCLYFNHYLIGGYPFRLRKSLWVPFFLCTESLKQTCGTITQVLDMTEVAEAQVALAAGAMCEAVDEWVAAVGGATKTTRSRVGFANPLMRFCMALEKNQRKKKDKAFFMAVVLFLSPPRF